MGGNYSSFYFEHVIPVSSLVDELMALKPPTLEAVAAIIAKADVAWITRTENDKLDEKKARSKRDDSLRTYKEAGIDLCPD